ncbi:hypothetical protein Micbo1qcDRAFT_192748 [Microdochium bolleyi]|uniref:Tyrosinase copper-binding domain-containing protein n=1 Tax=Microdochium bolleyi TaxID=196109 RepID=A0A136JFC0_9PEZI|nr:hypothetical protein Micbo1qcDRAFT_192748 [Microdochium bolleyi]
MAVMHFTKRLLVLLPLVASIGAYQDRVPGNDKDSWTLYLLALNWLQYTSQDSKLSYYQLAAIHGAPGLTWDSVEPVPGSEKVGYCHHVSVLFPTWHRPYMALYEQTLYNIVQFVATLWPQSEAERWRETALKFRVPYWDCCRATGEGRSAFPDDIAGQPTITTAGPNGDQVIANPLYSYTFKPFDSSIFPALPWNSWPETKRAPQPMVATNAVSNNSFVARAFDLNIENYQQRLYNLFAHYNNYSAFSNEAWITNSTGYTQDSVESLHDSIHVAAGGYFGHLAIIGFSAFDPFFFLHHVNFDRIFAMWQVLNPDSFVVPTRAVYSTHTSSAGAMQDADTDLTPFRRNDTSFWTSNMVRDHEVFGYTYQEVVNKSHNDTASWINKLYTTYSPVSMRFLQQGSVTESDTAEHGVPIIEHHQSAEEMEHSVIPSTIHAGISRQAIFLGDNFIDWSANIRADKDIYGTSYTVYLFLGKVPRDVLLWPIAKNLVGSLGVFGMSKMVSESRIGQQISGTIPLTSAIVRSIYQGHVNSLHVADATRFLRTHLKFAAALANGTIIGEEGFRGLRISIVASTTRRPSSRFELATRQDGETRFTLFDS